MKILITGATGMVGGLLVETLKERYSIYAPDRQEMDITDRERTIKIIRDFKPEVLFHCAAFTDVDGCEADPTRAYTVNALGSQNVAEACADAGSVMIYLSTDFIFNGEKRRPYVETDLPIPLSIYGETKLLGEYYASHLLQRFVIVRVSRVFGRNGKNFASGMPQLMRERKKIVLTQNLINSPTSAEDLVKVLIFLLQKGFYGILHVCNHGECSWYEYGLKVKELMNIEDVELEPVQFEGFKTGQADRPRYSVLSTKLLESTGFTIPSWESSLAKYLLSCQKN